MIFLHHPIRTRTVYILRRALSKDKRFRNEVSLRSCVIVWKQILFLLVFFARWQQFLLFSTTKISASRFFLSLPNRLSFYVLCWRKSSLYIRMRTTLLTDRHPSTTQLESERGREWRKQSACALRWIISVGDEQRQRDLHDSAVCFAFFVWQIFSGIGVKEKDMICFWWWEESFSTFLLTFTRTADEETLSRLLERSSMRHYRWLSIATGHASIQGNIHSSILSIEEAKCISFIREEHNNLSLSHSLDYRRQSRNYNHNDNRRGARLDQVRWQDWLCLTLSVTFFDWFVESDRRRSIAEDVLSTSPVDLRWLTSLTFTWSFADVSRKVQPKERANDSPCCLPTTRSSSRSFLFPTRTIGISAPISFTRMIWSLISIKSLNVAWEVME